MGFDRITRDRFLTESELERFITAVRERRHKNRPRDHAFFALLANTGIRPSEAMALRRRHLHLDGRSPWLRVGRPRVRPGPSPTVDLELNSAVAGVIAEYAAGMADDQLLFPFTKRQSRRLFHFYERCAGLTPGRRLYAMRHSVGVRLWAHTRDARLIQAVMGHVRLKAGLIYRHMSAADARAAFDLVRTVT